MSPQAIDTMQLKPFFNHLYEFKKGVRRLVLYTMSRHYETFVKQRLDNQGIEYYIQIINKDKINLFFGKSECIATICKMVNKPLNELTPEEDFILGALLGYDISGQCERYCKRKN